MALNIGNLIAVLGMDKKGFDKGIKEADEKTEGFAAGSGKTIETESPDRCGRRCRCCYSTAAILAADDMNKAYNNIRVGSGATGEALEVLKGDFDAVFGTVPADAAEVSTAIADLNTRLELTGEPLQDMATRFLELSRITGTDVGKNIAGVTRALANWGVAGEDQADTLDYLFRTSQSTGIGVDRLSDLSTKYGSTLRGLGYDLETSTALLGKFEKEGVNTEAALAGMKQAVARLAGMGIDDPIEAWDMLADQIKGASTELEAVSIASELFGDRAAAEMASAIRDGNLDLADFVDTLNASEETILDAADDTMTLGDRMAILKNKSQKALEPVGNLMIGLFEKAMPHLEAAGDALIEMGRGVATWAEEVAIAAGPVVEAFQEKMAPVVDFFQGKQEHLVEWWAENSEIFIAAWENVAAAITWVLETVIVPLFEWVWPYIESIYSGVLDTMLGVAKLFAAIIAGDWDAAGDALVDITKGAMAALNGVWAAGWDAIAAGIEFVGQGILDFVYDLFKNILKFIENEINKWIDAVNRAAAAVAGMLGISMGPLIPRISLSVSDIRAPQIKIPRWSETAYGQAIDEFLSSDEEDIDAEFEDMEEEVAEQPSILPASPPLPPRPIPTPKPPVEPSLPMVEVEEVEPLIPDIGAPPTPDEDPSVPTLPTIESPSVTIPDVDTSVSVTVDAPVPISSNIATPIPVTVSNWPSSLEDDDIDAEFDQEGSADQVSVTSEPTPRIGGVDVPIPELPEQEDRTLS